jgi:hypothetical protein
MSVSVIAHDTSMPRRIGLSIDIILCFFALLLNLFDVFMLKAKRNQKAESVGNQQQEEHDPNCGFLHIF